VAAFGLSVFGGRKTPTWHGYSAAENSKVGTGAPGPDSAPGEMFSACFQRVPAALLMEQTKPSPWALAIIHNEIVLFIMNNIGDLLVDQFAI
jgi:hypothetical protein